MAANSSLSFPSGNFSDLPFHNVSNNTLGSLMDLLFNITNGTLDGNGTKSVGNGGKRPSSGGLCSPDDDGTKAAKTLAYILVFLTSSIGNGLIVSVILKNKRMQTPVNFFILNMAISDLLITVFFMPRMFSRIFYGVEWQIAGDTGLVLCKISPSMQEFCSSLSVLLFMAISVDRFLAVVFPLKKIITKTVAAVMLLGIWFFTLAIRIPTFYGFKLIKLGENYYCVSVLSDPVADQIYRQSAFAVFYAAPLCVVVVLYSAVIIALKTRKRPGATSQTQQNIQLKRTTRIMKMLVTVVVSFTLCWFLYFCLPVLIKYIPREVTCGLYFPMFFFSHVNCAINPMVYIIFIENYRRAVRSLLSVCLPKGCCSNAVAPDNDGSTTEMRHVTRGRSSTVDLEKTYHRETSGCPL